MSGPECDGCRAACEAQIRDLVERLRAAVEIAEKAEARVAEAVEAEREACAQVAYHFGAHSVAAAIRARGTP